jgi:hypothetical protein
MKSQKKDPKKKATIKDLPAGKKAKAVKGGGWDVKSNTKI